MYFYTIIAHIANENSNFKEFIFLLEIGWQSFAVKCW